MKHIGNSLSRTLHSVSCCAIEILVQKQKAMIPDYLREFTLVVFIPLLCFNQTFLAGELCCIPQVHCGVLRWLRLSDEILFLMGNSVCALRQAKTKSTGLTQVH